MHSYRRVAAVVIAAGLLATAGCWNPAPEKYPSITYFGVSNNPVTTGSPVVITWQTRLAEKVTITASDTTDGGQTVTNTRVLATFSTGDTNCTINPTVKDPSTTDCVKDGTFTDTPTKETVYNIQATVGAGNCDRDPVLGNLLHPAECDDLNGDQNNSLYWQDVTLIPAATLTITVNNGQSKDVVFSGSSETAAYTVTNDSGGFDLGVITLDNTGAATYTPCDVPGQGAPCTYDSLDSSGNPLETGTVTVASVTQDFIFSGEVYNGASDGNGDISPGTVIARVWLAPSLDTWTVNGTDALKSNNKVSIAALTDTTNPPVLAWTTTSGSAYSLVMAPLGTAADCTKADYTAATPVTGATGDGTYTVPTAITAATCFQLTVTASQGTNTRIEAIEVDP